MLEFARLRDEIINADCFSRPPKKRLREYGYVQRRGRATPLGITLS